MSDDHVKKKRGIGQKIAFFFAIFCYSMTLVTIASAVYWKMNNGSETLIFSSILATAFFFASCGFVLKFISNPSTHNFDLKT